MGSEKSYTKEKLVIGVLISQPEYLEKVKDCLLDKWGEMDLIRGPFPFEYTDYYNSEMGTPISRWFFSFKNLVDPSTLTDIKLFTNKLEEQFIVQGKRKVNLDPGLMALSRFVLATTKDNAHRIVLRDGIYAETTLLFRKKDFEVLEWTYPDYQSRTNRDILKEIRILYKDNLKGV